MATPYIAGVAALYVGAYGGRAVHGQGFAHMLHQRIRASGESTHWSNGSAFNYDFWAPTAQVGTGRVNALKVLDYTTTLDAQPIALNDTNYFSRYHDIKIINGGTSPVTYSFSVESAAGLEAAIGTGINWRVRLNTELAPISLVPRIMLPKELTLAAGQSKTVSVNFDNPDKQDWNNEGLPLYSGKIIVSSSKGEVLAVPYMGVGADLRQTVGSLWGASSAVSGMPAVNLTVKPYFGFNLSLASRDYPVIKSTLKWGSREIRWDIYEAGWKERKWSYPPVVGENGYIGSVASWVNSTRQDLVFDPSVHDSNVTFKYPTYNRARNYRSSVTQTSWFGKLANGSQIANGKYTMRYAALRPFGRPQASDAWSIYELPEIEVR